MISWCALLAQHGSKRGIGDSTAHAPSMAGLIGYACAAGQSWLEPAEDL